MANSDPPNEIHDGETPSHRNINSPDADALVQQVGDGDQEDHEQAKRDQESKHPTLWMLSGQDDRANGSCDRVIALSRAKQARWIAENGGWSGFRGSLWVFQKCGHKLRSSRGARRRFFR